MSEQDDGDGRTVFQVVMHDDEVHTFAVAKGSKWVSQLEKCVVMRHRSQLGMGWNVGTSDAGLRDASPRYRRTSSIVKVSPASNVHPTTRWSPIIIITQPTTQPRHSC